MLIDHPNIEQPPDETVIWRYVDLERFIALLHTQTLSLCRIDRFEDPWEASWPQPLVDAARQNWGAAAQPFLDFSTRARAASFVSCWHESTTDSAALWGLYAGKSGVAIRSSVASLEKAIRDNKDFYIGRVRYIDFESEPPSELNLSIPPFLKRKSFEHEREIRVLHWHMPMDQDRVAWEQSAERNQLGMDPETLIESLYLAPSCPPWLLPSVQELCRRFNVSAQVVRSSLYDPRVY